MNILLVDDDSLILQELKTMLKSMPLSIEKLFMATCMEEAKKIIKTVPVQIMLCDIEMPGGSGLELLEWARQKEFSLECVFLTNYADFSYAKQAIRLESLEYLLKPLDSNKIYECVQKAFERVNRSKEDAKARQYWLDNGKEARDMFWQQHLKGEKSYGQENFLRLGYETSDLFMEVALKAVSLSGVEQIWGNDMFEYVLKNVLFELFDTPYFKGESVFFTPEGIWIGVCRFLPELPPDGSAVEEAIIKAAKVCEEKLHIEVICGVGYLAPEEDLKNQMDALISMMENSLEKSSSILRLEEYQHREYPYQMPDVSVWESLLEEKKEEVLKRDIRRYVKMKGKEEWSKQQMQAFRQDITQMFYYNLKQSGVLAHKLFSGEKAEGLYGHSLNSLQDMCLYCDFLAEEVIRYKKFMEEPASVIDKILRYVDEHYCEEINRSDLAELVYISNDYCSRIFRKETGRTLVQYVVEKRMEKAKKLLESDLSVKNVALMTGYSNFSYFSKVFKDMVGMTPMEYREKKITTTS